MKKLLAILALGTLTIVGCEPASSKPASTTPSIGKAADAQKDSAKAGAAIQDARKGDTGPGKN